jgi:hypothetical protein
MATWSLDLASFLAGIIVGFTVGIMIITITMSFNSQSDRERE